VTVLGCEEVRGEDTIRPHKAGFAFICDPTLHGMQGAYQSVDIAYFDPTISARRQRAGSQEVNIGTLAADEEESLSRLDAGVNF